MSTIPGVWLSTEQLKLVIRHYTRSFEENTNKYWETNLSKLIFEYAGNIFEWDENLKSPRLLLDPTNKNIVKYKMLHGPYGKYSTIYSKNLIEYKKNALNTFHWQIKILKMGNHDTTKKINLMFVNYC